MTDKQIIVLEDKSPKELFDTDNITNVIDEVKKVALSIVTDATTEKGRKEITSLARKVSSTKTAIDAIGKDYVAGIKAEAKTIDNERKRVRDELDALRDDIKAPVVAYENIEKERVAKIEQVIDSIYHVSIHEYESSQHVQSAISSLDKLYNFDFQEFSKKAHDNYVNAKQVLENKLKGLLAQEELEKQRKEQERKELEARIVKETEERVKREYEAKQVKEEPKEHKVKTVTNVDHKRTVNNAILSKLVELGCDEAVAKSVIKECVAGKINNMFIEY